MTETVLLPDQLVAWVEEVGGGRLVKADRKPGGARKEAWFIDLERTDGNVAELFLRYDASDPLVTKDPWTLQRESTVYVALADSDVPVPRVIGVHHELGAMVTERHSGESWFGRITDPAEREDVARDFMTKLAALHQLDPALLDLPEFPAPTTIPDAVRWELDEWDGILAARGGEPDPALTFTLGWLRRHIPEREGPVVLVQGDTGPGNFMFEDGHVVVVVDWELAHLGDPMEDIAWLTLRATQDPFPDLPSRLQEYEQLTGNEIDDATVHYYQVMAEAKLQVMSHRGERSAGDTNDADAVGGDVGNGFMYAVLHRRLWLEALAAATSIALTPAELPPAREKGDHEWMYPAILGQLRHVVVPNITDPLAKTRAKGLARMIKYLEQVDAHGAFYAECERDELAVLLGSRPDSLAEGRHDLAAAVRDGQVSDADYVGYLWHRAVRENELARPAMGVLADRHWPELR